MTPDNLLTAPRLGTGEEFVNARILAPARFVTDSQGVLQDANLTACMLVDLGRRSLLGRRFSTFVARADLTRFSTAMKAVNEAALPRNLHLDLRNRVGRLHRVLLYGHRPNNADLVVWVASRSPSKNAASA